MAVGDGFGISLFALFWIAVVLAVNIGVLVLIVLGIRWLIRAYDTRRDAGERARQPGGPEDPALLALRERFARGEIDAQEFEERRRVLGG